MPGQAALAQKTFRGNELALISRAAAASQSSRPPMAARKNNRPGKRCWRLTQIAVISTPVHMTSAKMTGACISGVSVDSDKLCFFDFYPNVKTITSSKQKAIARNGARGTSVQAGNSGRFWAGLCRACALCSRLAICPERRFRALNLRFAAGNVRGRDSDVPSLAGRGCVRRRDLLC